MAAPRRLAGERSRRDNPQMKTAAVLAASAAAETRLLRQRCFAGCPLEPNGCVQLEKAVEPSAFLPRGLIPRGD